MNWMEQLSGVLQQYTGAALAVVISRIAQQYGGGK